MPPENQAKFRTSGKQKTRRTARIVVRQYFIADSIFYFAPLLWILQAKMRFVVV